MPVGWDLYMKNIVILLSSLVAVTALGAPQSASSFAQQEEKVWGSDEATALQDADWAKVVRSCSHWVQNRENSQIKPASQNISCVLRTNGMEQVGTIAKEKTYTTDSVLTAGASSGKGEQRSETSQRAATVDTISVMCPVVQQVERKFRFDVSISCEDVAQAKWQDKIELCEDLWLAKCNGATTREEKQKLLEPYLIDKTLIGEKLVDCSSK